MAGFGNSGTEFITMVPPQWDAIKEYDGTKPHNQQSKSIPQHFLDAMAVREEVYGQQGVPLEAEFDEDDKRSWHWVVYASVGQATSPPSELSNGGTTSPTSKREDERRRSATAQRTPIGTIRLVPPPHGPNKYIDVAEPMEEDKHGDADPPLFTHINAHRKHPAEPYIKLGRLAISPAFQGLGLAKSLINAALEFAAKNPETVGPQLSPTSVEKVRKMSKDLEDSVFWTGLCMVHAQTSVQKLWAKYGFTEELLNDKGEIEIEKEDHWMEEGIEHLGMWKRINLDSGRL